MLTVHTNMWTGYDRQTDNQIGGFLHSQKFCLWEYNTSSKRQNYSILCKSHFRMHHRIKILLIKADFYTHNTLVTIQKIQILWGKKFLFPIKSAPDKFKTEKDF